MSEIASARINNLRKTEGIVPPESTILEIPALELQGLLNELVVTHNQLVELVKDVGVLRGRELARMTEDHARALKAERSPLGKLQLLNAYIRQLLKKLAAALKTIRSPEKKGIICQAITKIQLRAVAIVDHVRTLAEGKEKIALDSSQARQYLAGREGKQPSRRDAIRALRRAEKICPALSCGHTPNDGRMTMRVIAKTEDLTNSQIVEESRNSDQRQRLRMEEIRQVFFKETV